jgi:hypothetical protein
VLLLSVPLLRCVRCARLGLAADALATTRERKHRAGLSGLLLLVQSNHLPPRRYFQFGRSEVGQVGRRGAQPGAGELFSQELGYGGYDQGVASRYDGGSGNGVAKVANRRPS